MTGCAPPYGGRRRRAFCPDHIWGSGSGNTARPGPPSRCGAWLEHDLAELIPVVHVGEIQILHRCAGDDHAVILLILDLMEGRIKGRQVLGVSILGNVAQGVEQLYLDLERRVGELAQQLGLGDDLSGHQIQDKQVQRADVLMDGAVFSHDKDVLALQNGPGGQRVGDSDRHRKAPFYYSSRDKIRVSQGVSLCKKELDR